MKKHYSQHMSSLGDKVSFKIYTAKVVQKHRWNDLSVFTETL